MEKSPQKNTPQDVRKVDDFNYEVPTFKMTDQGASFAGRTTLKFIKGIAENPGVTRQDGFLPESFKSLVSMLFGDGEAKEPETGDFSRSIEPREIEVTKPKSTYLVRQFKVTNNGIEDAGDFELKFCKGNKDDESIFRQPGFFTETLIAAAKKYLEENNVEDLESEEGTLVIQKLDEALGLIQKRADDRKARGVQGTYRK